MGTLAEAARRGARALEGAGWPPDQSARDAEVLARSVLKWDAAAWLAGRRDSAPATFQAAFDRAIARRLRHEPVAYITGEREFYGRPFMVTPAVLIPRPETELVVDAARAVLARRSLPASASVVDVGTGSGCVAVTLALEVPHLQVIATDISSEALAVAEANARALDAAGGVRFVRTSLVAGLTPPFDLVVSNPPYVPAGDQPSLPADVRDYEPAIALYGGPDGLAVVRGLLSQARRALRPGGSLVVEIGAGQSSAVERLAAEAGLSVDRVAEDLAGIPRVIVANRPFDH